MLGRMILVLAVCLLSVSVVAHETKAQKDARMKWWREARFGLFIHWGTYSTYAGQYKGQSNYGEWIREEAHIPLSEYVQAVHRFNPVKFDALKWARMAKQAGMRYVTITTKHHEGFALFDSAVSDYDVRATPFKRDIMKELAAACAKEGLKMCWYHSIMDWHHPDYLPRRAWEVADRPADGADMDRYCQYLHRQVTELLTHYGPIGVMWFDGEWEPTWNHQRGQALYDLCRKLQPSVIVNNRVDVGRGGMGGMSDAGFAGDFGTPEQEIPATGVPGVDWETCMTMNDHWGYCRADLNYKSTRQILRMLCDIASKGGNYLLNVGPTPEGEFPPQSVQRLKEIGSWMKVNGEAIYGTRASVFKSLPWGRCTVKSSGKDTVLYLHVFDWPKSGSLLVPGLGSEVVSAKLLGGAKPLEWTASDAGVLVRLPAKAPHPDCSVVRLTVKGSPVVYETPVIHAEADTFVKPVQVSLQASKGLELRYTLDGRLPTLASPVYKAPFTLSKPATVKARGFHAGRPVTQLAERRFEPAVVIAAVDPKKLKNLAPGLQVSEWDGDWDKAPETWSMKNPARKLTVPTFSIADIPSREHVARRYSGYVRVSETNVYRFALRSDDGSRLWLDGQLVVDNDGLHSPVERIGSVGLAQGLHRIDVEWFNRTGGLDLLVRWAPLGGAMKPIDASFLSSAPNP